MRILEARDGFIKFESEEIFQLSTFIQIDDVEKSFVAQIVQIKKAGSVNVIYAKILHLIYNERLLDYDKSLPTKEAKISNINLDIISKDFDIAKPVRVGKFIDDIAWINLDKKAFDKKVLASFESNNQNKNFILNLAQEFKKSIIIDTIGIFDSEKYVAGADFKLPLNSDSLEFLYEDCLNDATSDSKALIKDIFKDLAEYSRTVSFLPFGALKSIVDEMVEKSHVFKLLVLKNKLAKFDKLGYFAKTAEEANNLASILDKNNVIIDLSKIDPVFQNRYLQTIYSEIEKLSLESQIFLELSNSLNKKTLKKIFTSEHSSMFVTHPRFKYISEIKSMFDNFIIEPNFINNELFKTYSTFLSSMKNETALVVGKETNYLPLITLIKPYEKCEEIIEIDTENVETVSEEYVDLELELALEDTNPSVQAINKKSEELIEKVSEEIQEESTEHLDIFSDGADLEENLQDDNNDDELQQEQTIITEDIEALEEIVPEIVDNNTQETAEIKEGANESIKDYEEHNLVNTVDNNLELMQETEETVIQEEKLELTSDELKEYHTEIDSIQTIEVTEEISLMAEEAELLEFSEEIEEIQEVPSIELEENEGLESPVLDENLDETESIQTEPIIREEEESPNETLIEHNEVLEVIPLNNDLEEELDAIVELDESEFGENDIIVELEENSYNNEILDKEIVEDVDKVFTTMKEDTISDDDLDFIDELNNSITEEGEIVASEDIEELVNYSEEDSEDEFIEPLVELNDSLEEDNNEVLEKRENSTPIVPVYDAEIPQEDIVSSDPVEQGDIVIHAKYGNGVVEKMIKYGTKTLYSINFDNVGRRLLDPTIAEIKKA